MSNPESEIRREFLLNGLEEMRQAVEKRQANEELKQLKAEKEWERIEVAQLINAPVTHNDAQGATRKIFPLGSLGHTSRDANK